MDVGVHHGTACLLRVQLVPGSGWNQPAAVRHPVTTGKPQQQWAVQGDQCHVGGMGMRQPAAQGAHIDKAAGSKQNSGRGRARQCSGWVEDGSDNRIQSSEFYIRGCFRTLRVRPNPLAGSPG